MGKDTCLNLDGRDRSLLPLIALFPEGLKRVGQWLQTIAVQSPALENTNIWALSSRDPNVLLAWDVAWDGDFSTQVPPRLRISGVG